MNREFILSNYRSKTSEELQKTFEIMNAYASDGLWVNFDVAEWLECAECMLQVIKERDGFGD